MALARDDDAVGESDVEARLRELVSDGLLAAVDGKYLSLALFGQRSAALA